jgi:hypothetical protein
MGNRKRKSNRQLEFTQELLDDIKRRKEDRESGRQIALSFRIAESSIRKRLEAVRYVGCFEMNV